MTTNMYDCGDGALPVLNEEECKLIWCSSLNKRVLFAQDCPFSKCPDGEELFNLNFCKNYDCADGSEVNAPEECNKFVCADGNKIDDIKKCVEYCEAPSDCNPNKAELKSCFGEWGCMNNTCAWNCEENFTSNTAKEIAISLEEIVGEGYSKLSDEKEEENEKGTVYVSAFENQREKVSFMQLISIPNQGISKTELANKFNGAINELIKKGAESLTEFDIGEDSFATKNEQGVYIFIFRKSNVIATFTIETETDEKAIELMKKFGKQIESRIN